DTAHQHQQIDTALKELAQQAEAGGFGGRVDLDTVRARLETALENAAPGRDFLTGGVTFCALVPMRSIPFRVVCLLGMNDGVFPRLQRRLSFDLMAQHPLPGDRSSRDDDRYLFLEALLAARERLMITYVGQSVRDNTEIPPSVVVSELLDVIDESFAGNSVAGARADLVMRHPLQPFSRRYFDKQSELFSYNEQYRAGAQRLGEQRSAPPPFVAGPLPLDADAERTVSVDDLARFFENPARGFLQRRLALSLGRDIEPLDDQDPLQPDNLDQWKIGTRLLDWAFDDDDLGTTLAPLRASGALPPGRLGEHLWDNVRPQVDAVARAAAHYTSGSRFDPIEVDFKVGNTRVVGSLRDVWPAAQLRYQFSKIGGYHELGLWIRHLLLNHVARENMPRTTVLVGRSEKTICAVVRFEPTADAQALLADLFSLYELGQRVPLPLFRRSSRAFAEELRKKGDEKKAVDVARKTFDDDRGGDRGDEYVKQIYAEGDPFEAPPWLDQIDVPSFGELAMRVWSPLLDHRTEES
ncbi:MAG TPA: hypothetical protein VMT89_16795, partial [Candidatus Acidoferrales bacterium]|nr:hypothetical protein [Candidatus Acidoferrales bacterium]